MSQIFKNIVSKSWFGISILLIAMSLCIYLKHTELVKNLHTSQMIDCWGDGLKTYTNAIYHIEHDSTSHWFEGMNYPYGEHIVPATELPGLAIFMKALKPLDPNISNYVVQAVHLEMLLALLLCALFIFLIFRELGISIWFSLFVAIGISFLSPQNLRMTSHYGLAQQFVIPCLFYLLLLYHKNPSWKHSFWVTFTIFIASFLHFYFFAITVFFVSGYIFFKALFNYKNENWKNLLAHYFLMCFVPLIFFWFWMLGQDPVTDRSPHPFGFYHYHAIWESIFTNPQLPYFQWITDNIIPIEKPKDFVEGFAYIGLPAMLFTIILLVRSLNSGIRYLNFKLFPFIENQYLFFKAIFWAALLLLFFSFCWPFSTPGLEAITDKLGPIRQFRSLGRFAWIFYYVINILAFYGIFEYFKKQKNPIWKWSFLIAVFGIFGYEIWHFNQQINLKVNTVPYFNRGKKFTDIDSLDFSLYQAIIPIPYFSIGSNNFGKGINGFISQRSYTLALQTGIPSTGAMLTRSSRNQTFNQWQLLKEPYQPPAIFEDMSNDQPFLLLWWKKIKPPEYQQFKHLLIGAELVFEENSLQLYETSKQDFLDRIEIMKNQIRKDLKTNLFEHQHLLSSDSLNNFIYQNFNSENSEKAYFGNGSIKTEVSEKTEILNAQIPNANLDSLYQLQLWVWVDSDRLAGTLFEIQETDLAGNEIGKKQFHVWPNVRTLDPKGWALMEMSFKLKSKNSKLVVSFHHKNLREQKIWVDELLIKPQNTDLYQKGEDWIWKNNLHFELDF